MSKKSEVASPTAAESKKREDKINVDNWAKQGNLTPAHNKNHGNPAAALAQTSEPGPKESKAREDGMNLANWGFQGNLTPSHNKNDAAPALAQTGSQGGKDKMVTNSYPQVKAALQKEKDNELVHP